jgi:Holliday junction DNA helicase RuvA
MIGSLRGKLIAKQPPQIVIECGGLGYEVDTPMSTFLELPDLGSEVFLHIHHHVREDAQTLFGFATPREQALFRLLLKVSGVGAKMGLSILSAMSVGDFERCVQYEDAATLVKIPGVGKKTADRLIVEMRDRIESSVAPAGAARRVETPANAKSEAADALIALGYKAPEVSRLLGNLETDDKSAEDIIRMALRRSVN